MMAAIDILSSELAMKNQRTSREKLRRLKTHLDAHRAQHSSNNRDVIDEQLHRLPLGD